MRASANTLHPQQGPVMLATLIHLLSSIRRLFGKGGRSVSLVADAFDEALDQTYRVRRKYPFAE
jgi:hypothetical protein